MRERASNLGMRLLALLVLLVAAWILFKIVVGIATAIAWVVVAVLAVLAIAWAIRTL